MALKSAGFLSILALMVPSALIVARWRRVAKTTDPLTDKLQPLIDDSNGPAKYSELWNAMGGFAGLRRMNRESMIAIGIARGLRKTDPEFTDRPGREMFWVAICLWFVSIASMLESAFGPKVPKTRAASLWSARLYCEMTELHEVLEDFMARKP